MKTVWVLVRTMNQQGLFPEGRRPKKHRGAGPGRRSMEELVVDQTSCPNCRWNRDVTRKLQGLGGAHERGREIF